MRLAQLNADKANKNKVHDLYGTNPDGYSLLQWASDGAKRLSIWRVEGKNVSDFPDNETEWCALNLQDATQSRGIVVAFGYDSGVSLVKYRCYFSGKWYSDWKTIV